MSKPIEVTVVEYLAEPAKVFEKAKTIRVHVLDLDGSVRMVLYPGTIADFPVDEYPQERVDAVTEVFMQSIARSSELRPLSSPERQTVFVSDHHRNEVRKHFDWLVKKYTNAPFMNTNTEAGCIWNDAVNLARGIKLDRF